jgi:hypothetical protein
VEVTTRRTKEDFAQQMKALVEDYYPKAKKIRVVLDNLNTHTPAALYETFEPALWPGAYSTSWSSITRPNTQVGFHEKACFVKANVVAITLERVSSALSPRFHSHSLRVHPLRLGA